MQRSAAPPVHFFRMAFDHPGPPTPGETNRPDLDGFCNRFERGIDMGNDVKVSRRSMLKSVLVLSGAACAGLLSRREALAQAKASKAAMKYQDQPNGDKKCSECLQFVPPDSCKVVEGVISPDGYCIAFVKKP